MSQEDVELLKAVREWKPPEELHPMAMTAWHFYEEAGNDLTPEVLSKLKEILDEYGDNLVGLAEAIEGLVRFMLYVGDNLDDKKNAQAVGDLMRSYMPLYEPFWERVGEALNNVSEEARGAFHTFLAGEHGAKKQAPTFGEKAPDGTVPLKDLAPVGRPPPWASKNRKK